MLVSQDTLAQGMQLPGENVKQHVRPTQSQLRLINAKTVAVGTFFSIVAHSFINSMTWIQSQLCTPISRTTHGRAAKKQYCTVPGVPARWGSSFKQF